MVRFLNVFQGRKIPAVVCCLLHVIHEGLRGWTKAQNIIVFWGL